MEATEITEITGAGLRRRLALATPRAGRRRRGLAVGLLLGGLGLLLVTPALASGDSFRLQGSDLRTEFVSQPYWAAPGALDGHHVRLEAGLLGFRDGGGITATGYCIDARAHRRHDAVYVDGALLAQADVRNSRQVLWLLGHAFPNGPSPLGTGWAGEARSSSAVQAAIWHFSDDFNLDPAGAPGIDAAYRQAYDTLLQQAATGAVGGSADLTLAVDAPSSGGERGLRLTLRDADGAAVPDGTEVAVSADMPLLRAAAGAGVAGQVRVRTQRGEGRAWISAPPSAARLVIRAEASLRVAPGRVLVANLPTQRLVETSWGQELVRSQTAVEFAPAATPSPTAPTVPSEIAASSRPTPAAPPTAPPTAVPAVSALPSSAPAQAPPPPPGPVAATPLPNSAVSIVTMPVTGRRLGAPLGRAAGLVMCGSGLIAGLGWWPTARRPRRVRYGYRPPGGAISGCARPARRGMCRWP